MKGYWAHWATSVFIAAATAFPVAAQVSSFRHFGIEKSVFPSRVECLAQLPTGELAIGTLAGMVVYDGVEFRQVNESHGLSENAISSMGMAKQNLWIGHWTGSVTVMNTHTNQLTIHDHRQDLGFSSIVSLLPVSDSAALLVTRDGALFLADKDGAERVVLPGTGLATSAVKLYRAGDDLYCITSGAIFRCANTETFSQWNKVYENIRWRINGALRLDDQEWLLATNTGAFLINTATGDAINNELSTLTAGNKVMMMAEDSEETVWLGTAEHGLVKYHEITGKISTIKRENGLSYNQVRAVMVDREGIVWVATAAGLDQYLGDAFKLFDKRFGFPENLIWDFENEGNQWWLATVNGLFLVNADLGNSSITSTAQIDLQGNEPRSLFKHTASGKLWVVDASGGLWSGFGNLFTRYTSLQHAVRCLEEVNGQLWVGTDHGVYILNDETPSEHYTTQTGLGGDRINGIYYSKITNETWITALGAPLTLLRDGRFRLYGPESGLTSNVIQDAAFDKAGKPWFATYDDGVIYLSGDTFTALANKVPLTSTTTFAIEIDGNDNVWIGNNWGIDQYRMAFNELNHFGPDQGFMGVEVNPGSIHRGADGQLWMATLMGLLRFSPEQVRTNINEPVVTLLGTSLGGLPVNDQGEHFGLNLNKSDFEVQFRAVSLVHPEANKVRYRLVGAHDEWRETTGHLPITYQALPPGDYRFELMACNNSGHCNANPQTMAFTIYPPFYRTWWFLTLLFLGAVLLIFFLDRFRVSTVITERNKLSEQLAMKEQEWSDLMEETQQHRYFFTHQENTTHAVSTDLEPATKWFGSLHERRLLGTAQLTDRYFTLRQPDWRLGGLMDTGEPGALGELLIHQVLKTLLEWGVRGHQQVPQRLDEAAKAVFSRLTKTKGCQWVVWAEAEGKRFVASFGIPLIALEEGRAIEISQSAHGTGWLECTGHRRFLAATDGLFTAISADGTRTYQRNRLLALANDGSEKQLPVLLDSIADDFALWAGTMKNEDSITIIGIE